MRLILISLIVATAMLSGCGEDSVEESGQPVVSDIELTPAGTREFVLVGETGVFFNTAPGVVDTPTLIRITRFPSVVGLVAPVPEGFGFVAAADLKPVDGESQIVVAAPVILRIPPAKPLPEGRRLLVMVADTLNRVPVFQPFPGVSDQPTLGVVRDDGSVEFQTMRLGSFLVVDEDP